MKEKLTLQDLVDLLAKKTNLSKKDSDAFFREFFAVITDSIFDSEPVRIKDFGTFKLTQVSSRESVNVNTGEKIEIPAHSKLSFLPDKLLKELVNKPFSQFETTLLEDGVSFESIDTVTEEVVDEEDSSPMDDQPETELEKVVSTDNANVKVEVSTKREDVSLVEESKPKSAINTSAKVEQKSVSEAKVVNVPRSYTYTYTFTEDKKESDPITITLPKEALGINNITSVNVKREQPAEPIVSESAVSDIEPIDIAKSENIVEPINVEVKEIESETIQPKTFEEANKVQEKIGHLRDVLNSFNEPITQQEEQSFEEDILGAAQQTVLVESLEEIKEENSDLVSENEKIELPNQVNTLDPKAETESSNTECFDEDDQQWHTLDTLDHKVVSDVVDKRESENVDEDTDEDLAVGDEDGHYYYDEKPSFMSRLWKKIPFIIFFAIVLGYGIYSFVGLFTKRYNYEYYLGRPDLITPDTLPFNDQNIASPVFQDSMTLQTIVDTTQQKVDTLKKKDDKYIINDRLSVGVNRAANNRTKLLAPGESEKVVVKSGANLRSLSREFYGTDAYWGYIYLENKSKIKNYNNISIGTVLVIPDLTKYNVDTTNKDKSLEKAQKLENEIMSNQR